MYCLLCDLWFLITNLALVYPPDVQILVLELLWNLSVIFMPWTEFGMTLEPTEMSIMWLLIKLRYSEILSNESNYIIIIFLLISPKQKHPIFASRISLYCLFLGDANPVHSSSLIILLPVLQAIHKLSEYLSFQVRNIAGELVDSFDLPDHVTRAPIAMQSEAYAQYTQLVGF